MDNSSEQQSRDADDAFAAALRAAREGAGLSQAELAERMAGRGFDFHQQTIYKIESGRRRVSVGEAATLANLLNVTLQFLIGEQEGVLIAYMLHERERRAFSQAMHGYLNAILDVAATADAAVVLRDVDTKWLDNNMPEQTPARMTSDALMLLDGFIAQKGYDPNGRYVKLLRNRVRRDSDYLRRRNNG